MANVNCKRNYPDGTGHWNDSTACLTLFYFIFFKCPAQGSGMECIGQENVSDLRAKHLTGLS